eukprot:4783626-Pyramimonas_sp.AAC.1
MACSVYKIADVMQSSWCGVCGANYVAPLVWCRIRDAIDIALPTLQWLREAMRRSAKQCNARQSNTSPTTQSKAARIDAQKAMRSNGPQRR